MITAWIVVTEVSKSATSWEIETFITDWSRTIRNWAAERTIRAPHLAPMISAPRAGLMGRASNTESMEDPLRHSAAGRVIERRVDRKGLRPRVAASVIAVLWLIAIVVFGVIERLIDPDSFDTIWDGMWWATQTVTTVGYGDVVPDSAGGQLIAAVLMVGGLSFFAVVTGVITSVFVTRAQAERRAEEADPVARALERLTAELGEMREQLDRLGHGDPRPPPR